MEHNKVSLLKATLESLINQSKGPVEVCDELSEEKIWSLHAPLIWKTRKFIGSPQFYPVYKYQNLYSYSLLSLILYKGSLQLNHRVARQASKKNWLYLGGKDTIDREITRVGGPIKSNFVIKEADEYARRMAEAMIQDTATVEASHPGFTNIILCGGKDSLNLLLLP